MLFNKSKENLITQIQTLAQAYYQGTSNVGELNLWRRSLKIIEKKPQSYKKALNSSDIDIYEFISIMKNVYFKYKLRYYPNLIASERKIDVEEVKKMQLESLLELATRILVRCLDIYPQDCFYDGFIGSPDIASSSKFLNICNKYIISSTFTEIITSPSLNTQNIIELNKDLKKMKSMLNDLDLTSLMLISLINSYFTYYNLVVN